MKLGAFSVSLAVKDLAASRAFYAKLGFEPVGGDPEHGYQILRSGQTTIGLFQGMFEQNILTFNPGWGPECETLPAFDDVREIHAAAKAEGLETAQETGLDGAGPGSFVLVDPDGNPVLIDQHVPRAGA